MKYNIINQIREARMENFYGWIVVGCFFISENGCTLVDDHIYARGMVQVRNADSKGRGRGRTHGGTRHSSPSNLSTALGQSNSTLEKPCWVGVVSPRPYQLPHCPDCGMLKECGMFLAWSRQYCTVCTMLCSLYYVYCTAILYCVYYVFSLY